MSQTVLERTAEHIAETAHCSSRATSDIAAAIEHGAGAVRRVAKQGSDVAEEFLNHTTQGIEQHLALTMAMTFAAGLAIGTLIGWAKRSC